ncbi:MULTISPECIES: hypothetical protein [unclassified Sphingomonas]|uniref:hypothetical protein n=1 Tax=unclassified Sphingomonas TaxID=196159 RepID=UPI0006F4116A|nr:MULTISPECIES: hypothetical protein [unclassified Sphingomonas]KQM61538.1 hypothetical protein ASE65_08440 [Sphingomonas sp. Leaf16]KQN12634.1 hypothetical protein ASE81_09450 [Sphingomonas sp. Leaf29]KQN19113.1 hypothetical protein ASE83_09375 [Sphingomonas sp. Leaf32]
MNRTVPPVVAGIAGLAVAVAISLVPTWRIETVVSASGLPALLPIAEPPLGWTARVGLMLLAALLVAVPVWIALSLLVVRRPLTLPEEDGIAEEAPPSVRRADAHPDAPPRPPVRAARDLGMPFLDPIVEGEPELDLPRDLNTPMAMFDPEALPMVPAAPPPTVRPLFRPPVADADPVMEPEPVVEPDAVPPLSVEALAEPTPPAPGLTELIDRLDRGLQRRRGDRPAAPAPDAGNAGLASALGALRRMAGGE